MAERLTTLTITLSPLEEQALVDVINQCQFDCRSDALRMGLSMLFDLAKVVCLSEYVAEAERRDKALHGKFQNNPFRPAYWNPLGDMMPDDDLKPLKGR